jgi:hypothetical protein
MPILLLMGARDVLRGAERIKTRPQQQAPHLTTLLLPEAGHALLTTTVYVLLFLATAEHA